MIDQRALNRLWGGRLETLWLDPLGDRAEVVISVVGDSDLLRSRIVMDGLLSFKFVNGRRGQPWVFAETTVVLGEVSDSGAAELSIVLWDEENEIVIHAHSMAIESISPIGSGSG